MNDLQMGLLALGGAAVAGVVAYNQWQAAKARKVAEALLPKDRADVLMNGPATADLSEPAIRRRGEARQEPSLAGAPALDEPVFTDAAQAETAIPEALAGNGAAPEESAGTAESVLLGEIDEPAPAAHSTALSADALPPPASAEPLREPVAPIQVEPAEPLPAAPAAASAALAERPEHDAVPLPETLLSPRIDDIVSFESVEPIDVPALLHAQHEALRGIDKPVTFAGFNEETLLWEDCEAGLRQCRRLRVGLQLADRRGAAAEGQITHFRRAMEALADDLTAVADLAPQREALVRAQQVDAFCASVDIQVGVNVVAVRQAFAGTKLRALAEAAGMEIDATGAYVKADEEGWPLYRLLAHDPAGFAAERMKTMSVTGMTFLLDVPRVAAGERLFNQMSECARRFAETLGGQLVDDNRAPLTEPALAAIRTQIGQYQARMKADALPAGGALARRLFN